MVPIYFVSIIVKNADAKNVMAAKYANITKIKQNATNAAEAKYANIKCPDITAENVIPTFGRIN